MNNIAFRFFTMSVACRISAALFLCALVFVMAFDRFIMQYLIVNRLDNEYEIFHIGRALGAYEYMFVFAAGLWGGVFIGFLCVRRNMYQAWCAARFFGRNAVLMVLTALMAGIIAKIIKFILGRPRPLYAFENNSFGLEFFATNNLLHSFPSGHTTTQAAVIFSFMVCFPRLFWLFGVIGIFWVVCNSIVLEHWPSDIFGGVGVCLLSFTYLHQRFQKLS